MKEKDINSLEHTKWRCQYQRIFYNEDILSISKAAHSGGFTSSFIIYLKQ